MESCPRTWEYDIRLFVISRIVGLEHVAHINANGSKGGRVATNLEHMENLENLENSGNLKNCQNLREKSGKFEFS